MAKNRLNLTDIEIPSNSVTLESGISNRHSRTKGDTINGNVYKLKKTTLILIVILIISLVFVVLFYRPFTRFAVYSTKYMPNCNFSLEQHLNITHNEGLVAYFRFNNYSFLNEKEDFICDISSKNHRGLVYNAALNSTGGVFGDGAFEFDGLDSYIEIADSDDFSPNYTNNRFSVSFWVKFNDVSFVGEGAYNDYKNYLGKSTWGGGYEWEFRQYNSSNLENRGNRLSFYAFNITGGLGSGNYVQENITLGEWMHLVGTINGTHTAIYRNGVFKGTSPLSSYGINLKNGNSSLRIGTTDFTTFLNGSIDEFRAYNKTLNSSEIFDIYSEDLQRKNVSFGINETNASEPVEEINSENSSNYADKTGAGSNNKNLLTGKTIENDNLNEKNKGIILKIRDYIVSRKKGFLLAGTIIFVSSFLSIIVQYLIFKHRKLHEL